MGKNKYDKEEVTSAIAKRSSEINQSLVEENMQLRKQLRIQDKKHSVSTI